MEPPFFEKPTDKKRSPPSKPKNSDRGGPKYLTPEEVNQLIAAAQTVGRHAQRDSTIILICYRHALRVSELIALRWNQVDLDNRRIQVHRLKKGTSSVHKLEVYEVEALTRLKRDEAASGYVFVSERNGPLTRRSVHGIISRAGRIAGIPFAVHPYMLRHAKGYQLGAKGLDIRAIQAFLGHRNIQHSTPYAPARTEEFDSFDED